MDIFNTEERPVVCVDNTYMDGFSFGEQVGLLNVGKTYTVVDLEVHSWHTMVTLREFPNRQFNSCHFEELK